MSNQDDQTGERETLLTFPCKFPIKAMGKSQADLQEIVLQLVRKHSPEIHADQIKTSYSSAGNYMSITITVHAESQQQLDNIYIDLSDCEHISIVL